MILILLYSITKPLSNHTGPGMPLNVSAVVNSPIEIAVYWEEVPAFNRNGSILFYEVLYRSTLDQTQTLNTTDNSTFILLLRVEEFVEYNITVRAYTVAGAGVESMPVVIVMTPAVGKFLDSTTTLLQASIFHLQLLVLLHLQWYLRWTRLHQHLL